MQWSVLGFGKVVDFVSLSLFTGNRPFFLEYFAYSISNKTKFCECLFSAGPYYPEKKLYYHVKTM